MNKTTSKYIIIKLLNTSHKDIRKERKRVWHTEWNKDTDVSRYFVRNNINDKKVKQHLKNTA